MQQQPVLLLTGELLKNGEDWDIPRFGALFGRLQNEVKTQSSVIRYLRLYAEIDGATELRFFGITGDTIENIPDGMVGLELGTGTYTVYNPSENGSTVVWQAPLTWDWLDLSKPLYPVGDFRTHVPARHKPVGEVTDVHFILSAFSYGERGKTADDNVKLTGYNPNWPGQYEAMKDRLQKKLTPDIARRIEHYGSTAIPGMPAKPVIDILIEIPSYEKARQALVPLFNRPECEYWWYNEHMTFIVRDGFLGMRQYHIHAAPAGNRVWEGLAFRDYLIGHPDDAKRYADLKYQLAESHASDREAYTDLKADFVREITEKA
jgi:GrpB-like predicted nucleotidyltransferase (UPF0157 family)